MSGPDRFRLDFGDTAIRSSIQIEWQRHYWLDDSPLTKAFSAAVSPRLGDLLDIAMAIYAADRLCRRPPEGSRKESGWSRRLELRVPVQQPEFWRRGIGYECAMAWLDHGFNLLGLERIVAIAVKENIGSWKIMEKCGMHYEGEQEHYGLPVICYAIEKAEFDKMSAAKSQS